LESTALKIDFKNPMGLVPVVVQSHDSRDVLMLAYMNQEALDLTLKTKTAHYFSRSKNRLWKKGETSGHFQKVIDLRVDCDQDTILLLVEQAGLTACHTGAKSCFFTSYIKDTEHTYDYIKTSNRANLPTKYGDFKIKAYKDGCQEHLAIMSKDFKKLKNPIVRIHSECLTGDTMQSLKCDCNGQLDLALKLIAKEGGLIIYHRQEGRNIGLVNKVNAYSLQDQGYDTIQANLKLGFRDDERDYSVVGHILKDLKLSTIQLVTNNPKKIEYIEQLGLCISQRIPSIASINKYNKDYIHLKKEAMGHLL